MKTFLYCLIASALVATTVAEEKKKENTPMNSSNEVAVIKTNEGEMVVQFWTDAAPSTIENFKKLARQGFYDGTIFHRIVKGFMIQGGDPNSKDLAKESSYGMGDPGYKVKAEFNDHAHDRGVISMARGRVHLRRGKTGCADCVSAGTVTVRIFLPDRRSQELRVGRRNSGKIDVRPGKTGSRPRRGHCRFPLRKAARRRVSQHGRRARRRRQVVRQISQD